MIRSSVCNPIFFKELGGDYPNDENTLHENLHDGNRAIFTYYQKFNNDDQIILQFISDSATVPQLTANYCNGLEIETFHGNLDNTVTGDDTRYYYSFQISFHSDYHDKKLFFVLDQDTTQLTSEPVECLDLTDLIALGIIKKFEYANSNRKTGELNNFFVDWDHLPSPKSLFCWVEGVLAKTNDKDDPEKLEGSQSVKLIGGKLSAGYVFESANLPAYMVRKVEAITSLEYLSINGQLFTKVDKSNVEPLEKCTFHKMSVNLMLVNASGINVDLLGGLTDMADKEWIKFDNRTGRTSGYSVAVPAGYDFHMITIIHGSGSSTNTAVCTCGKTPGGTEYFDAIGGEVYYGVPFVATPHDRTATTIYITISGVGVKLDISLQFLRKQPFT